MTAPRGGRTIAIRRRVVRAGRRTVLVFRLSPVMRRALRAHARWGLNVRVAFHDATGRARHRTLTVRKV